jgi:polysaccharide pyruvyl transferase WcaK-like protein
MKEEQFRLMEDSDMIIVGGSNLLGNGILTRSELLRFKISFWRQWALTIQDAHRIRNAILIGAGWWHYEKIIGPITRMILRAALSDSAIHSVRDEYTKKKLISIGIKNVINTGCPTMWSLADIDLSILPTEKSENVLFTVTDTQPIPEYDAKILRILNEKYKRVFCWPQGSGDKNYVASLGIPVVMLDHSILAIENFVRQEKDWDYVGSRLHGGIFCLRAGKRSLIIKIDNRATEISKNTGLYTVARSDFEAIQRWIDGPTRTVLDINTNNIEMWRSQFKTGRDSK